MRIVKIIKNKKKIQNPLCEPLGFWGWLWRCVVLLLMLVAFLLLFCLPNQWYLLAIVFFVILFYLLSRAKRPELHTGDVQITLRWETSDDLDLHCKTPCGDEIWYSKKSSSDGGQLDVDANASKRTMRHPVENIFWGRGLAPKGAYLVKVHLYDYRSGKKTIPFKVTVKVDGTVKKFKTKVDHPQGIGQEEGVWTYSFERV